MRQYLIVPDLFAHLKADSVQRQAFAFVVPDNAHDEPFGSVVNQIEEIDAAAVGLLCIGLE